MSTMKEAIVAKDLSVSIIDTPIPKPGPGQVLTKVIYSGANPKDWKVPIWTGRDANQGDDHAGTVHAVGPDVTEFQPGDRVAAFHQMMQPGGSYAEYAISWAHVTFRLPPSTSFAEGAALPLAALTAAVGLYDRLRLPEPWLPAADGTRMPLVVYGASSAVGAYVLQFARRSNIHPLICVAGRAQAYVESLIDRSKGDTIVDYRGGDEAVVKGIKEALKGEKCFYAYDAVSEKASFQNLGKVLESPGGKITVVLPYDSFGEISKGIATTRTSVGDMFGNLKDLGYVYCRYMSKGLEEGWFKAQPQEVVPGGLTGIEKALRDLKDGKASAVKYVFKISDTPGVAS